MLDSAPLGREGYILRLPDFFSDSSKAMVDINEQITVAYVTQIRRLLLNFQENPWRNFQENILVTSYCAILRKNGMRFEVVEMHSFKFHNW